MDDVQAVGKLTAACPEYKAATSLHQSACNRAWGTSLDAGFGQVDPAAQPVIDNQHPLHLSAGQAGQPLRNPQTAIQTRGQHGLVHLRTVDEATVLQCRPEGITSSRPVPSSPYKQPVHHLPGLPNRSRIKLSPAWCPTAGRGAPQLPGRLPTGRPCSPRHPEQTFVWQRSACCATRADHEDISMAQAALSVKLVGR